MERPANLPKGASWNEGDSEWELGERRENLSVGDWKWWRPEGTLLCESRFDANGTLHGDCQRYHPNGEVSYSATYKHGAKHGKEIVCRPTEGQTTEVGALQLPQIDPELFRMESLYINGALLCATLYNRKGLLAPIAIGNDGHAEALGEHLHKLLPGTDFKLTTPFLHTMGSTPASVVEGMLEGRAEEARTILPPKVPRSMITRLRYICAAVKGGSHHRIEVIDHRGQSQMSIIDADNISRSLTLAVDAELFALGRATNE